ncbi:MAG TPA: hypothetical protein VEU06_02615 [Micropepsaceae bacterium]|nr:hypothetical protein [Micropepsaceae bacterium]
MFFLKIVQIGDSLGIILPDEVLADLHVKEGDELVLTGAPGGYRLMASDPELRRQLEVGREVMRRHAEALRILAKS